MKTGLAVSAAKDGGSKLLSDRQTNNRTPRLDARKMHDNSVAESNAPLSSARAKFNKYIVPSELKESS